MGGVATNNEIRLGEIEDEIQMLSERLADEYDEDRSIALDKEVRALEVEKANLEKIEKEVCPECGNYISDWEGAGDDLGCMSEYHLEEFDEDEVKKHTRLMKIRDEQ